MLRRSIVICLNFLREDKYPKGGESSANAGKELQPETPHKGQIAQKDLLGNYEPEYLES